MNKSIFLFVLGFCIIVSCNNKKKSSMETEKTAQAVETTENVIRYVVEKGSVAIDGISLTVAKVSEKDFSISAIPHTVKITVLGERKEGDIVNLETDIIGKYVEKLITPVKEQPIKSNITRDFLNKYGF